MVQQYPDDTKNKTNKTDKPHQDKEKQSSSFSNSCPFMQKQCQLYLRKIQNLASIKELLVLKENQVYQLSLFNISSNVCETCGKAIGNDFKISASTQISDASSEITIYRDIATGTREAIRDSVCENVSQGVCSKSKKDKPKKSSSTENTSGKCYEKFVLSQESLPYWVVQRRRKLDDESQNTITTPTDSTLHKFVCKADCCTGGVCPNSGSVCPYKVPPAGDFGSVNVTCVCTQNTDTTLEIKTVSPQVQSPTADASCDYSRTTASTLENTEAPLRVQNSTADASCDYSTASVVKNTEVPFRVQSPTACVCSRSSGNTLESTKAPLQVQIPTDSATCFCSQSSGDTLENTKAPPQVQTTTVGETCVCAQSSGSTFENTKTPPQAESRTVSYGDSSIVGQEFLCSGIIEQIKDVSVNVSMESDKNKPSIGKSCTCINCSCSTITSVCQFKSKSSESLEAFIVDRPGDNLVKGELGTSGLPSGCANIECIYSNTRFTLLKCHTEGIQVRICNEDTPSDYPAIDISEGSTKEKENAQNIEKTLIGPVTNSINPNMKMLESFDAFKAIVVKDALDPIKAKPKAQPSNNKKRSKIHLPARSNMMILPSGTAMHQSKAQEQQKSTKMTDSELVRKACKTELCKAVWSAIQNRIKLLNLLSPNDGPSCTKTRSKSGKTVEDVRQDKDRQTPKLIKNPQKLIENNLSTGRIKNNDVYRTARKPKLVVDTGMLSSSKAKLGIDSKEMQCKPGSDIKTRQSTASTITNKTRMPTSPSPPVTKNTNKEHAKIEKTAITTSKIRPKGSGVVSDDSTKAKEKDQKRKSPTSNSKAIPISPKTSLRDGTVCMSQTKICPAIHRNEDEFAGVINEVDSATFGNIGNSSIICSVCSTISKATSALHVTVSQTWTEVSPARTFCDKNEGTIEWQVRSPPEMRLTSEQGSPASSRGFLCSFPTISCPMGSVSRSASPTSYAGVVSQDNEAILKLSDDLAVLYSGCGFWHKLNKFPTVQEMKAFTPLRVASLCQCDVCNCKICLNKTKSPSHMNPIIEKKPSGADDHECECTASNDNNHSKNCKCTNCSLVAMKKEIEALRKKLTDLINGNKNTKLHKQTSLTKFNQEATATFKRPRDAVKKPVEVLSKKLLVHTKMASKQSKEHIRIPSSRSSKSSSVCVSSGQDPKPKKNVTNSKSVVNKPSEVTALKKLLAYTKTASKQSKEHNRILSAKSSKSCSLCVNSGQGPKLKKKVTNSKTVVNKPFEVAVLKKLLAQTKTASKQSKEYNRIPSVKSSKSFSSCASSGQGSKPKKKASNFKNVAKKPVEVVPKKMTKMTSKQSKEHNRVPTAKSSLYVNSGQGHKPKKKVTNSRSTKKVPKEWYMSTWK